MYALTLLTVTATLKKPFPVIVITFPAYEPVLGEIDETTPVLLKTIVLVFPSPV